MDQVSPTIIAIVTAIVGLAMVAVIVSQKAQTPNVIKASGSALSSVIAAAVSPVVGNNNASNFGAGSPSIGGLSS